MSTYKKIHGKAVKSVSTNLSDSGAEGQIWFNTTDNKFRSVVSSSAWVSASNLGTARYFVGSAGIQTAAFAASGTADAAAFTQPTQTEEYNGSGWSLGGSVGTARYAMGSAGTLTAGLICGGRAAPAPSAAHSPSYSAVLVV